jgi:hypothetical protein
MRRHLLAGLYSGFQTIEPTNVLREYSMESWTGSMTLGSVLCRYQTNKESPPNRESK